MPFAIAGGIAAGVGAAAAGAGAATALAAGVAGAGVVGGLVSSANAASAANSANKTQAAYDANQEALSNAQWQNYVQNVQPALVQASKEAQAGVLNPEQQANLAAGDVAGQYANTQGTLSRDVARYGLNPATLVAQDKDIQLSRAANEASAMTTARQNAVQQNFADLTNIVDAGSGIPGQANQAAQGATSGATAGANIANNQLTQADTALGQAASGLTNLAYNYSADQNPLSPSNQLANELTMLNDNPGMYAGSGVGYDPSTADISGLGYAPTANSYSSGGLFSTATGVAGSGLANGGPVQGPGTGTSDSVPENLSAGEFVIPADVVRAKGAEFFQKLIQKYHRPVMQRGLAPLAAGVAGGQ